MSNVNRLVFVLPFLGALGCTACPPLPGEDGGTDAGHTSRPDAGPPPRDGGIRRDGGNACTQNTPGYGAPCGECGVQVCSNSGVLTCADPGYNGCGVCGPLDMDGGILHRRCGTCGQVTCADGGLGTECTGDHELNECGSCATLPAGKGPPDASCSACGTGRWVCATNQADLSCWGGVGARDGGSCQATLVASAELQDLTAGLYVRTGTRALIRDVGADVDLGTTEGSSLLLTLDPLVLGPGGGVLEAAVIYLSPTERHDDVNAYALAEFFSAYHLQDAGYPADPVRQYHLWFPLEGMQFVIIYDGFLDLEVARGRLVSALPPGP